MDNLISYLKLIPILIAAIVIGNWFQSELKRANAAGKPLYTAYLSIPGIIILLAILVVPILLWFKSQ